MHMMAPTRRTVLTASAGLGLVPLAAGAQTRWQFATPYPDGNFHTRNVRQFVQEAEQGSGGRLAIQLHTNASLLRMPEIRRGVQTGQAQLGEILLSAYANEDPFFALDGIPQLVTNYDQARRLMELSRPFIEARMQRTQLTLLYMVPWPPSGLYSQAPLDTIDALRGTRMRTFSPLTNRFATLAGATPTLVQVPEIPQAFATGVVNTMVTSAATGVDSQAWDFVRVFTPIGFTFTKNAVFVNTRAFEALPVDVREAVRAAAQRAEQRGWEMSQAEMVNQQNTLAQRGMQVREPTPALMEGLNRIGAQMVEEWLGTAGEDGRRVIEAYRRA
jgi:TRAP-type C4-dicarboxylate transport system substrate-binding protein